MAQATTGNDRLQTAFPYVLLANAAYAKSEEEFKKTFETSAKHAPTIGDTWSVVQSKLLSISNPTINLLGIQERTDTQVFVAHVETADKVPVLVISFRGTEMDADADGSKERLSDWETNLDFKMTSITFWDRREKVPLEETIKVHDGFLNSFKDVTCTIEGEVIHPHTDLRETMDNIMAGVEYHSVVCCGHSLGGALATLCALYCLEVYYVGKQDAPKVSCYTIGSPRVGDAKFVEIFNQTVPDSIRIVNKRDIVPAVPLGRQEYMGVDGCIWMKQNGSNLVAEAIDRPSDLTDTNINDHMGNNYEASIKAILSGVARTEL